MEVLDGENALMLAVRANNLEVVIKHISRDINLEHKNVKGKTALYIASDLGHASIVAALLDAGAKSDAQNAIGWTPLDIASFKGHKVVVDILRKHILEQEKGLVKQYSLAI